MYDNDLVMKMHGSTTTREYIRRFVRLVRMDKSALRVDTSRQYWTFLFQLLSEILRYTDGIQCQVSRFNALLMHLCIHLKVSSMEKKGISFKVPFQTPFFRPLVVGFFFRYGLFHVLGLPFHS